MEQTSLLTFRLAHFDDFALIKAWWNKPHVKIFWDNSPEMWQNCENFLQGKKDEFDYWIGYYQEKPYCLFLTSDITHVDVPAYRPFRPKQPDIWTIDFLVGEEEFLGKGYGHFALREFVKRLPTQVKTVLIDPDAQNEKAVRAYQKAGFEIIGTFTFTPKNGEFSGKLHYMMQIQRQ